MDVRSLQSYRLSKPELAVFVSGVTSMGLQILALRIVAPQFGSSIYTVGSIITVFLAALSLGYWQGGKRAERATIGQLTWLLLGTAVYVAVLIYGRDLLLTYTSVIPLSARYASLPAVIVLFGPPTYLLGFISPYAAELSQKEGIGEASGHVYALGTIGSIVGSGVTTFSLIPAFDVTQIGLLFGFILVGTALALTLPDLPRKPIVATVVVSLLLVAATLGGDVGLDPRGEIVHQEQTAYQELEVVDSGSERTMYLDGARHSAKDLEDPDRHVFAYTHYFHLPMLMVDDPDDVDRVLFVGGGGYTGPQDFEDQYDVDVDVVEIDPDVTEAAETYFGLEESDDLTAHTGDGLTYLADMDEGDEPYDLIVLDAYRMDQVPFELTTKEFMELAESRLSDDGILLANVISSPSGPASEFYRAEYKTVSEAFPEVYSFRTSESSSIQNIQLIATKDDTRLSQADLESRNDDREGVPDLETEIGHYMDEPETDDVPVLRDDRAPVDSLLDPMVGQRYVIEETGSNGTTESSQPAIASPIASGWTVATSG